MHCTYNVTVRSVSAAMVAVDKNSVLYILSVFVILVINNLMGKRLLYCHLLCVSLYRNFPPYLIHDMTF